MLRIGEAARQTGLSPHTLRYYEYLGLIRSRRNGAGYRLYDEASLARLRFIRRAVGLGFSLEEIREIIRLCDGGQEPCEQVKVWLDEKIRRIEAQIRALEELRSELVALRSERQATSDPVCCPILEARPPVTPQRLVTGDGPTSPSPSKIRSTCATTSPR